MRLSTALQREGITEQDLAGTIGCHSKTVKSWVMGRHIPIRAHQYDVMRVLHVVIDFSKKS